MATSRIAATSFLSRSICRQCKRISTQPLPFRSLAVASTQWPQKLQPVSRRQPLSLTSSLRSDFKTYEFEEVKKMSESPSPDRILIDVREPSEVQQGYIPSAINVPVKSQPDAWYLPEEEFEDRFGFSKPETDQEVVFYCRSGVRSNAAARLAQQNGYQNVSEYKGSWLDWQEKGGPATKGSTLASTSEASATSHAAPMASTTQNHPYIFQRASTMATRSLLSNANPSQLPPASSDSSAPSTLPSTSTKHYEQAAAEATRAGHIPATTAASAVASVTDRPGTMRQPSWKMSDLKGQQQSQLVSNAPGGHGYSTTQAQ